MVSIAKLLTTHFNHNGYQEYPDEVAEKTNEEIIGIKDVIHSIGALLSIIQTFPKVPFICLSCYHTGFPNRVTLQG